MCIYVTNDLFSIHYKFFEIALQTELSLLLSCSSNSIAENTNIMDSVTNWNTSLIKELLHIKLKKSVLNSGLKASKELQLFN